MNKTDKIYDIADNLDYDAIRELTNGLDMQKIIEMNDNITEDQIKNKRFVFKRLSFAASVALFTVIFGLVTMTIAIAANILVPRFFPGIGTVDVEPQAIRELAEPVYLENPDIYNVAIDYAVFIRNGDGSGTLLLEYTYLYETIKYDDYTKGAMAGDIIPDDDWEMPEYPKNTNPWSFTYTIEPCGADEANDNLPVLDITHWTWNWREIKTKYNYENVNWKSFNGVVEDIEESEYYKIIFDNGQTAVIQMQPLDYEPPQSLWTKDEYGFKIRVTPYSKDSLKLGFEIIPTEDWSDTVNFSIDGRFSGALMNFRDLRANLPDHEMAVWRFDGKVYEYSKRQEAYSLTDGEFVRNIPDRTYKDSKGGILTGYNNFTIDFKENYERFLESYIGKPIREYLESGGAVFGHRDYSEDEYYKKEDYKMEPLTISCIRAEAAFDENKSKRQKVKLPEYDGEIELNQEVVIKGMKYYIDKVRRNGDKIEIDIATERNKITGDINFDEYAGRKARILNYAYFGVDGGYKYKIEHRYWITNNQRMTIVAEGIDRKTKNLDIYMIYAEFWQFNNWSVDISHLAE